MTKLVSLKEKWLKDPEVKQHYDSLSEAFNVSDLEKNEALRIDSKLEKQSGKKAFRT